MKHLIFSLACGAALLLSGACLHADLVLVKDGAPNAVIVVETAALAPADAL